MKRIINKMYGLLALVGIMLCLPATAVHAADEEPIIVLKSSAYETYGEANSFQILIGGIKATDYIDVDCGFGPEEHELVPATVDGTGTWSGTLITCNVSKEGTVKIYGDASNIDVLNVTGCYLTSAEFPTLTNLTVLDLSHNELESADLTPFTKLQALYVDDNPFQTKPLVVGANKPNLTILEMGQITGLDPSFNLSDYPSLVSFNAWSNQGLTRLDPTGCPLLQRISIDSTPVTELDVTKNTNLSILNISDTGIRSIDVSKNTNLTQLYCDHMSGTINPGVKLSSLDVTNNPNLVYLYASGNGFTEIDVTKNRYLRDLYLDRNNLTSINIDNNPNLLQLSLRYNRFYFSTLPLPSDNWSTYEYAQSPIQVERSQKEGTVIDLSDKVLREGTVTTAKLYMTSDNDPNALTELGSDYYTYADGKVTLLKATTDSVYAAFSNDAFPVTSAQPHCTNKFIVKTEAVYGQDDKVLTFKAPVASSDGTPVVFGLGINGATEQTPKKFYVDYGKGKVEYTATSASAPATPNVSGTNTTSGIVTVYVPEGELVTALDIDGMTLNEIDLSALHSLVTLRLVNTGLYSIDLGWNRSLTKLEMTGNHFSELNMRGANDAFQKNMLHDIDLSNNEMKSVTLNDNFGIYNLNLSNNKLTELSFKDADNIKTLDLSDNELTSLDLNYCTQMTTLDVSGNNLTGITLPAENALTSLDCSDNAFTFSTLPALTGLDRYVYAPQHEITIAQMSPGADLSAHNLNGNTVYVWKDEAGNTLTEGTDYTEEDGKTHFLEVLIGKKVYCEMTNPAFAGLTLKTSLTEASSMPTNVFVTFTTTANATGTLILRSTVPSTPIYIDWKGDGVELEQYMVGTTYSSFEVTSYKDAEVKVYSYNDDCDLDIFSISGIAMSAMDASKLTKLVTFTVKNAGLSDIKWPASDETVIEITLDGNNFSTIDLTRYKNLRALALNQNKFTTFDASVYPSIQLLELGDNLLTSVKLNNANLWQISLSGNKFTEIDLSGAPNLENLSLSNNELTSLDLSGLSMLKAVQIDSNKFRFSTLPLGTNYQFYVYGNQAELPAAASDMKVDLSSEAVIDGTETVYRWFLGEPYTDAETGELSGEELYVDDEYTLDNGVTSFAAPINGVMCVLTNEKFPSLTLKTPLLNIVSTGIDGVSADVNGASVRIDGGNILINGAAGMAIRLYNVNGQLVRSAETQGDGAAIAGINPGVYVLTVGKSAYKVVVR